MGWIWASESKKKSQGLAFEKKRMHESVIVLGGAIQADFVRQCVMKACRSSRLKFCPPSCIYTRNYLQFKLREAVRHISSSFSFKHNATKVQKWLIWLQNLWFWNQDSCLNSFVCLLVLKLHDLCRQTQRKPENTVFCQGSKICCGILQSFRLWCSAFKPIFVNWVTLWRKSTAYWSCCNAKQCSCSSSVRSN